LAIASGRPPRERHALRPPADSSAQREVLVERLFEATFGAWDLLGVYLGDRLGLYRVLAQVRSMTASDVAGATGTHVRYVREWLEQQAASGILEVEDAAAASDERCYSLSPGHVEALLDESSQLHRADRGLVVACMRPVDGLMDAFRSGADVT
jgi:hypothetical protein